MESRTTVIRMINDERMGAFDAVMWGIESDPLLRSVIVVVVTTTTAPDRTRLTERVDRLTRVVPKLRQCVIGNPMSLIPPRWVTQADFDMDYHLRWVALAPDEGNMEGVLRIAERAAEQDFDRDRPLWELTVATGLDGSGAGIVLKLHHAITDGVGGMMLAATLFDTQPEGADLGPMPDAPLAHPPLDAVGRLASGMDYEMQESRGWVEEVAHAGLGAARRVMSDPLGSLHDANDFALSATRLLAPAGTPLSPLMTKRSLDVRCALLSAPLSDLKAAGKAAGGTLNDAFMAVVSRGLRAYHSALGADIRELRVNMPVNMRTSGDASAGGNAWVPARFALPLDGATAAQTIRELHPVLLAARTEPALPMSTAVYRLLCTLPGPLAASIAGGLMKGTDVAATNVPGPPFPVFIAGARVTRLVPFAPKGGAALNIALMTYDGTAFLGITIDPVAVTDPELLTACLSAALHDVVASAQD
jgi:diacylglycerol O-acyltransferase / wax synthase